MLKIGKYFVKASSMLNTPFQNCILLQIAENCFQPLICFFLSASAKIFIVSSLFDQSHNHQSEAKTL